MARGAGQKQKLLVLQRMLLEHTDEEHPLTTQALIDGLAAQGIPAEKLYLRLLLVTDFISGMTDSYAKRLYQELNGIA